MTSKNNVRIIFIIIELVLFMVFWYENTRFSTAVLICTLIAFTYICISMIIDADKNMQDRIDDEFNIDE